MLDIAEHPEEEQSGEACTGELRDDIPGQALPGEVAAKGKRERYDGVQMRAGDGAHEENDRHDHEPGRNDRRGEADLALAVKEPAAGGDEHEHEGAEKLREEPAPLQARVVELGLGAKLESQQLPRSRNIRPLPSVLIGHSANLTRDAARDLPFGGEIGTDRGRSERVARDPAGISVTRSG